jgi:hypothetical protein
MVSVFVEAAIDAVPTARAATRAAVRACLVFPFTGSFSALP